MKIDVTKIKGYEEMTADAKIKALLDFEFEDRGKEIEQLKNSISKANTEAADYKRQLKAQMDEAQRKEFEAAEAQKAIQTELDTLRLEKTQSINKTKLMEIGYDAQTADIMSKELPNVMSDDYFNSQKVFLEKQRTETLSSAINKQPGLSAGMPPTSETTNAEMINNLRKWAGLERR